jgi:uncharacterized protein
VEHARKAPGNSADILLFLALVFPLSAIFYGLVIASGHLATAGGRYVAGLMWMPATAALLTVWIRRLDIRSLGWGWAGTRWSLIAYLVPLAYALIAYLAIWLLGLGGFADPATVSALAAKLGWSGLGGAGFILAYFVLTATTGMIGSVAHALGEEIGWRGFLAPRMAARFGFTGGALLTGAIWASWHFPILLFADYNSGTPWWFGLSCFTVLVLSDSVIMTWLRLRTNSVWPCAIVHASHNLFIQAFFTPLTSPRGTVTPYVIDEFGVAVPVVVLAFALWFWGRRGTLQEQ